MPTAFFLKSGKLCTISGNFSNTYKYKNEKYYSSWEDQREGDSGSKERVYCQIL